MYVCCIFGNAEPQVLHGLVKRWLEDLKDDKEEILQAVFLFRYPIIDSVKHICCNLYASANHITDGFPSCQVIEVIIPPLAILFRGSMTEYLNVMFSFHYPKQCSIL